MRYLCLASLLLLYPAAARATDEAALDALHVQATQLLEAGKLEEACAKLDASYASSLLPSRLIEAGDCFARVGKTASAWERYRAASGAAERYGQDEVAPIAAERLAGLEPKLTLIQIETSEELRATPGLVIRVNQKPIDPKVAVPVDPGTALVDAEAPDHVTFHAELATSGPGVHRVRVKIQPRPKPVPLPATEAEPSVAVVPAPAAPKPSQRKPHLLQNAGYVVGGVGGLALVLGVGFNLKARSQAREANALCLAGQPASSPCTVLSTSDKQTREERVHSAQSSATTSYVLLGVGAAAVATSAILIFTAVRGDKSNAGPQLSASFSDRHVAVTLGGSL